MTTQNRQKWNAKIIVRISRPKEVAICHPAKIFRNINIYWAFNIPPFVIIEKLKVTRLFLFRSLDLKVTLPTANISPRLCGLKRDRPKKRLLSAVLETFFCMEKLEPQENDRGFLLMQKQSCRNSEKVEYCKPRTESMFAVECAK